MKKRYSEDQIIKVLEEVKRGLKVEEVCRKYGISEPTYYNWKAKFGGMTITEVKRACVHMLVDKHALSERAHAGLLGQTEQRFAIADTELLMKSSDNRSESLS